MADIKQAAIWLKEGKKVRRKCWFTFVSSDSQKFSAHIIISGPDLNFCFDELTSQDFKMKVNDLLAEDWELYEESEF